jgi:hypothetical protein
MFLEEMPAREKLLGLRDSFAFRCHEGLSCFNTCCRNKLLPLTPYDVLRLKVALGLHSDDFLQRYTAYSIDPLDEKGRGPKLPFCHGKGLWRLCRSPHGVPTISVGPFFSSRGRW